MRALLLFTLGCSTLSVVPPDGGVATDPTSVQTSTEPGTTPGTTAPETWDTSGQATVCVNVRTQLGDPLHEAVIVVQPDGDGTRSQLDWTDPDGDRCFPELVRSGRATLVVHEPFHWRPSVRDVIVPVSGELDVDVVLDTGVAVPVDGESWQWGWDFVQRFEATGDALLKASIRVASAPQEILVEVRDGGSVVCSGSLSAGNTGTGTATFGDRGVCPLVPGMVYDLAMWPADAALGGWAPYVDPGASYLDGDATLSGTTQPWDVGVTLDLDQDGVFTEHVVSGGGCEGWGSRFAQTFTATGTELRSAGFVVGGIGSEGSEFAVSVHQDGPDGAAIGVGKLAFAWPDNLAVVGFAEGEVPLEPGRDYAIVLEALDAGGFCLYTGGDETAGTAWQDSTPLAGDAWGRILTQ